jgi:hypothetical protein
VMVIVVVVVTGMRRVKYRDPDEDLVVGRRRRGREGSGREATRT